jgi:ferrous iron transport protein A
MHDMLAQPAGTLAASTATAAAKVDGRVVRLGGAQPGDRGVIVDVQASGVSADHGVDANELHRRLLEFGFVEGARVEVLHEGAIRRDPIAVRLDDMRIALRRRDAEDVWVLLDPK